MIVTRPLNSLPTSWHRRWANAFYKGAALVLAVFLVGVTSSDASSDTTMRGKRSRPSRFFLDVGATFGIHSSDFFRDYKYYLRGPSSTFNAPETVRLGVSSYQIDGVGFGVTSGYYRAAIRETYDFKPSAFDSAFGLPAQSLSQTLTLSVIPIMITADLYPIDRQFTTYVGVGAGIAIATIVWDEAASATQAVGARRSGQRYDNTHVVPAFMLRTGVSLGLDRHLSLSTSASIHLEVSYTIVPVSAPLFKKVSEQIPVNDPVLRSDYAVQAGGIGIHAGISFFLR